MSQERNNQEAAVLELEVLRRVVDRMTDTHNGLVAQIERLEGAIERATDRLAEMIAAAEESPDSEFEHMGDAVRALERLRFDLCWDPQVGACPDCGGSGERYDGGVSQPCSHRRSTNSSAVSGG